MVVNYEEYLIKEDHLAFTLLSLMQENLAHLFSRFRCKSDTVLFKILRDQFNQTNERILMNFILAPLDV